MISHHLHIQIRSVMLVLLVILGVAFTAAAEEASFSIIFQENRFTPQHLDVPVNQPLLINVTNTSTVVIEFESFKLNREKLVQPGQTITLHLPALTPGSYDFYDDFHQDVPEGVIAAK